MSGTVHVVDDDESVLDSIRYLMESVGLEVQTYPSAERFFTEYRDGAPACLVLDLRMPDISGLETQQMLIHRGIDIPTIIITGHGDVPAAVRAMKLGAIDFLEKPCSDQVLLDRVQKCLSDDANRRQSQSVASTIRDTISSLTPRESEVMNLVVAGKSNKQAAKILNLSPKTIETHRASVMRKLEVESLADLVRIALSISE